MIEWLKGKKTYIVSGLMAAASLIGVIVGDIGIVDFFMSENVMTLLEAAGFSSVRAAIAKKAL